MTVQVVVADDDPMVRLALRTIINHEPDLRVVGEAADGDQVIEVVSTVRPAAPNSAHPLPERFRRRAFAT